MHIEYFQEFAVLGKLLNFGIAAEQLYITQPVLSRHIQALERHLGVRLLYRSMHGVRFTEEGKAFYEKLPEFMAAYERLLASVKLDGPDKPLSIRIGLPDYAIDDYLKDAPKYVEENYNLDIEFFTDKPNNLISALLESKTDAIIIPNIPFPGAKQLHFFDLMDERMGVLCSVEDTLAAKREIDVSELREKHTLHVDDPYFDTMWNFIDGMCMQRGFSLEKPKLFKQIEAILIEISNRGRGVTILGEHMKNRANNNVVYIPFSNPECRRKISLCCRKENNSRAIQIMHKALKTAVGEALSQ